MPPSDLHEPLHIKDSKGKGIYSGCKHNLAAVGKQLKLTQAHLITADKDTQSQFDFHPSGEV